MLTPVPLIRPANLELLAPPQPTFDHRSIRADGQVPIVTPKWPPREEPPPTSPRGPPPQDKGDCELQAAKRPGVCGNPRQRAP